MIMEPNDPLHHDHLHHHHDVDLHHPATVDDDDEALIAAAMDAADDQDDDDKDIVDHHHHHHHLLEPLPFEPIHDTHTNGYSYHNEQEQYYRQTESDTPGSNQKGVKISRPGTVHHTRTIDTPEVVMVEQTTTWDVLSGKMMTYFDGKN